MVSNRCKIVVKEILKEMNLHFLFIDLGEVEILENITPEQREILRKEISKTGLELIDDKKSILVEKIKILIIQLVHHTEEGMKVNFSDYLSDKLNHNYNYLANLFTEIQGTTIEHFIILQKIEKVKELMIYDELSITEIAYKMNYSSSAHLSTQFKNITGLSPSHFKQLKTKRRNPIDAIGIPRNSDSIMPFINIDDTPFQNFLESFPDAIIIVNNKSEIKTVNSQAEILFGYDRIEILQKKIDLLLPNRFREVHHAHMENYFKAPKIRKMGEGRELFAKHKNGEEFPVEISLSKLESNDDIFICASIRNVSHQKQIEKELVEAKISAENLANSKQQFLANMSHEIRTPMNAILGFTKVVLKTNLTEKQKEYLKAIKMSGDTLLILINDILDLAKVDSGNMVFETVPFKLSLSISTMLHLFEPKIKEKNLKLQVNYDENIPEIIEGDSVRLHQIVLNLLSNAVKFTSKGKILVTVNIVAEDSENITIAFSISDTGIGIEESKIDRIFDNFQQANNHISHTYGGTGLGLAIVKQLVEKQGGEVEVESKIGKGSTFRFALTFKKSKEHPLEENEESINMSINARKIKALVVEDVELNQLLMTTLLRDFGFESEIAANGKIAIEKLAQDKYDIILMDLHMPIMDGFQTTEYIRNTLQSQIPIVALSADVTSKDREYCKIVGMNDYIPKPVDENRLYDTIISLIKRPINVFENSFSEQLDKSDQIKYVDMSYLYKITKSNPKLIAEMIHVYLQQTPLMVKAMKESLLKNDWHTLKATVHKMIPSITIMGLQEDLYNTAKKIHEYAHTLENSNELHFLVEQLSQACSQTYNELKIELKKLKK